MHTASGSAPCFFDRPFAPSVMQPDLSPIDPGPILDSLNAWDALDRARRQISGSGPIRLAFGPKPVAGPDYAGAVIWKRAPGYHGYKILTVVGIWCARTADAAHILIGSKRLPYQAPFFDPEAYHKILRRDYLTYYADDGAPPAHSGIRAQTIYDPAQRLALRRWLAAEVLHAALGCDRPIKG